jgi:DNA-binding transcriptional regulator LsrR (DeoR family)
MDKLEENKLLSKISRLHYLEDINQQKIAEKLNISRTKVSRYLTKARKENIVEIKINSAREKFEELENAIEKKFGIKECIVVPTYEKEEEICKQMALSLSNILERILKDGNNLGIGWGVTLRTVTDYLEANRKADIKVIPLLGGLGKVGTGVHTNSVAKTIADKYGGVSYVIHSPAVLDSKEAKEIIEKDSHTSEVIEMSNEIDTAIIGMGDIGPESTLVKTGNFKIEDFNYLSSLGVVGDVNLIFINEFGEYIPNEIDERVVRASIEKIRKINNVIGVGFGIKKIKVIIGALRGKIINILITDEATAKNIIKVT